MSDKQGLQRNRVGQVQSTIPMDNPYTGMEIKEAKMDMNIENTVNIKVRC